MLWTTLFASPAGGDSESYAIVVSADGSKVFVTGRTNFSGAGSAVGTVAYDAVTGAQLWFQPAQPALITTGRTIGVSADGSRVYVGGDSASGYPTGNVGFLTLGYDATSGQNLWARSYIGPGGAADTLYSLVVDPATDRVFVTGYSGPANRTTDYAVVA